MRALCGAIITAGSLIGLGLVSIALGIRYADYPYRDAAGKAQFVYFRDLDTGLTVAFVVLLISLVVGMAIAFAGLAYHHHRRHLELTRLHHGTTSAVPPATSGERIGV